ncbi:MAG: hypothetical protein DI586_02990 [Micavibrio aeruginosavorus]|uniref:Uncharacterized protein n=1 Tax=Micavibrio aeruginosavorus TaxID=349221 RepID=A0A2W5HLX0_9BACT|nr:MAG: hypothetical protein DI586_02990 [Micavibrio aeruginosavorus]
MKPISRGALFLAAACTAITVITMQARKSDTYLATIKPSSGIETAQAEEPAPPVPARPLFKKNDPAKVTTLIAETPDANGINGAPKILKTDLGMDVSPLCFEQLFGIDGPKGPIDVTNCETASGYKNIKTGTEEGRYRSLYEFPSEPDMPAEKGFSSYELLGEVKGGLAVESYNETGGTGRFSSLILVTLVGNTLSLVDQIAGGDRCNGGLTDAKVENGELVYSINATPGDFPVLAWGQDKGIKAYEDLEASAMSCFATVTFKGKDVQAVTFNPDAGQQGGEWTNQYAMQACFNKKFQSAAQIKPNLTPIEFRQFMDGFLADCSKK